MTAITATVSAKLDFEDIAQIKSAIEAMTTTSTSDTVKFVQGANGKARAVLIHIA